MNILVIHNSYQQRGGEDVVVAAETALLRAAGHRVHTEIVPNTSLTGFAAKADAMVHAAHDPRRAIWMDRLLAQTGADIVHIHNFFPLLTPAIHQAAAERGAAVVQTLHNYRLICANGLFLRDGNICEKCLTGGAGWSVAHRCYRGSLPGSLAVAAMQRRARRHQTWHRHVHRFIALSQFSRGKFVAGGLPAERVALKPNFVVSPPLLKTPRAGALFVGRLSPEKGVHILLDAWRQCPDIALTIVGDGPERSRLEAMAPPNVIFRGALPADAIRAQMLSASCLIVPSLWYEGFPLVMIEAFAAGLPVLASRLGSMIEIIQPARNGNHFAPGQPTDLAAVVKESFADLARLAQMGATARLDYEALYTPSTNLARLEAIYVAARAEAKSAPAYLPEPS